MLILEFSRPCSLMLFIQGVCCQRLNVVSTFAKKIKYWIPQIDTLFIFFHNLTCCTLRRVIRISTQSYSYLT